MPNFLLIFVKEALLKNLTRMYAHIFNAFAAKGLKYDLRQQNNDFDQSGVSSQLTFCTGSLEVASN